MVLDSFLIITGLAVLISGAEALVRGASSIAAKFKIAPLIIGLTIVSFGTSAPELTVNIVSALNGSPDLATGNVVGSNIANILLVLGVCAVIAPLTVKSSTVWKEIPLALLGICLLFVMGNDALIDGKNFNSVTRSDGIVLMSLMAVFMFYIVSMARGERAEEMAEEAEENTAEYATPISVGLVLAGMAGLVIGGEMLVSSAISIAKAAGLSESLIGLTIVGIGTSLPELATSVVAALRKKTDIAIGNIVGSNIFNIFWILGLTATILQLPFNPATSTDVLVSVGATALLFIFMFLGKKHILSRLEGLMFLVLYAAYIIFLVIRG